MVIASLKALKTTRDTNIFVWKFNFTTTKACFTKREIAFALNCCKISTVNCRKPQNVARNFILDLLENALTDFSKISRTGIQSTIHIKEKNLDYLKK